MPVDTEITYKGCQFISETPDTIFSVEQFSGDEPLMIQTAEQFSRSEVIPMAERLENQEDGLMPGLIRKAGELGLIAVEAKEEYGGLGLGKTLSARILEYMSLNASMSVTFGVTSGIGQVGLSLFGTEKQKAQYLPKLVIGESIAAYCLSEPNSGSDALSGTTRADFRNGKWILNGTKMWISNAKWADHFLVMAKIDGEKFSAFLVERDFPGISISREEHKMGLKGSSTARVVFEDAEVPEENLLHQPGLGHQVALNALNLGRYKLSAMSIGPARDAIGLAAQYALDRKQFGQSISNFGLIRQKFAEMAARFYVAESMIYRTGAYIDTAFEAWAGTIDGNRKAAEQFSVESSMCKVFCSDVESLIVDEALQVYGGYGFTEEFPIARHYRDARISKIYEGTNEINRVFIASRIQRRFESGDLSPSSDGFIADLAAKAIASKPGDQIRQGALSDLVILSYAEQSARLRAKMTGTVNQTLYDIAVPWMHSEAARAFQIVTGELVTLPATSKCDWHGVSDAVFAKLGPLS